MVVSRKYRRSRKRPAPLAVSPGVVAAAEVIDDFTYASAHAKKRKTKNRRKSQGASTSVGVCFDSFDGAVDMGSSRKRMKRSKQNITTAEDAETAGAPSSQVKPHRRMRKRNSRQAGTSASSTLERLGFAAASMTAESRREKDAAEDAEENVETEQSRREDRQRMLKMLDQVEQQGVGNCEISDNEIFEARSQKKADVSKNRKVFVGSLPFKADPETVREYFERCGDIDSFNMPTNKETGKPMGVAFIVYADQNSVERALLHDGTQYGGRKIRVSIANTDAKGKGYGKGKSDGNASGGDIIGNLRSVGKGEPERGGGANPRGHWASGKSRGKSKGSGKSKNSPNRLHEAIDSSSW